MALSGPIIVVADEAIRGARGAGAWRAISRSATPARTQAAATIAAARPSAVVLAFATPDPEHAVAQQVADAVDSCDGSHHSDPRGGTRGCAGLPAGAAGCGRGRVGAPRAAPARRAARARAARHGAAPHRNPGRRRRRARHRRLRSDRGRDRAGRRARPQLSGAHRRDRRAHGPDRRALDRDRAQLSRRARRRRRGDRRRLQSRDGRGFRRGDRRRSALARPAGDRAAERAQSRSRAHAECRPGRRRPAGGRGAHPAVRAHACLLGAAQAPRRLARPEGHRSRPKPA